MSCINYIYEEAEALKRKHDTNDPFFIITAEGIVLKHCYDFHETKGFYYVSEGFRYIGINGNLDETTKRIVAAHELGHDVLHRDWATDFPMNDIALYGNGFKIERQANDFAANFLLSDELVWNEYAGGELGTEYSSVTVYPKPLLYYKLADMKRRGFNLPDGLIEGLRCG